METAKKRALPQTWWSKRKRTLCCDRNDCEYLCETRKRTPPSGRTEKRPPICVRKNRGKSNRCSLLNPLPTSSKVRENPLF